MKIEIFIWNTFIKINATINFKFFTVIVIEIRNNKHEQVREDITVIDDNHHSR